MPKYINPRKTWKYSNEFKAKAVQLSLFKNTQVKTIAKTLGIHPYMLSRWRKEYREGKIVADKRTKLKNLSKDTKKLSKLSQLEQEIKQLKLENELLKKWRRFLAEEHHKDICLSKETEKNIK